MFYCEFPWLNEATDLFLDDIALIEKNPRELNQNMTDALRAHLSRGKSGR